MRRNKVLDFWFRKQYVIAASLVLCAGLGMTALYNYNQVQERTRLEQEIAENEQYIVEETQMEDVTSIVPPKNESANQAAKNIYPLDELATVEDNMISEEEFEVLEDAPVMPENQSAAEEKTVAKSVTSDVEKLHFSGEEGLLWPMDGNVIMNYSMDATIYHATLDQYKYNPAIIISGAVNNKVYSVAKGKITEISQNEVTGTTVKVDLGDGYQAIYGQLKELNFAVGDYLESGHVIGYVSEPTKYYSVEGSNLYFELQKDGEPIDPIVYFE